MDSYIDDTYDNILPDIERMLGVHLVNIKASERKDDERRIYPNPSANRLHYKALCSVFERYSARFQQLYCLTYFSVYPYICDISTDISSRIAMTLWRDKFDIYIQEGCYGRSRSYHTWLMLVDKMCGEVYYIDQARLQFMSEVKLSKPRVLQSGIEVSSISVERSKQQTINYPQAFVFPKSVISPSNVLIDRWLSVTSRKVEIV